MQLALLGQIGPHGQTVERIGQFCLESLGVSRVVYLGTDDSLDIAISDWAQRLAGPPDPHSFWLRTLRCVDATPDELERFVDAERRLTSLKRFEALAPNAEARCLDSLGRFRILLCHRALAAQWANDAPDVIIEGAEPEALFPQPCAAGAIMRLAPGALEHAGLLVLEDVGNELNASWYNRHCQVLARHSLSKQQPAEVRA